jgi:hypothetical protein
MLTVVPEASYPNATSGSAASLSPLDEIVRDGARQMLAAALSAEVAASVEQFRDEVLEAGHRRVVRHGYHAPREVTTVAGAVPVTQPRVNDKRIDAATGEWKPRTPRTRSRWSARARKSRKARSSNAPTNQEVTPMPRDTPINRSRPSVVSASASSAAVVW